VRLRMLGLLLASRLVELLALPRRSAHCRLYLVHRPAFFADPEIDDEDGARAGLVHPDDSHRGASWDRATAGRRSAMGLDPPPASSQWRVQPSHSALALHLRCGQDCRARPGSRQRSRSRGADQTSARTGDAPPPFRGAGRLSSTSAGRPLKRDEQTLYAAGTNAPLHIGGRDCLQLPAAATRIFVENLR